MLMRKEREAHAQQQHAGGHPCAGVTVHAVDMLERATGAADEGIEIFNPNSVLINDFLNYLQKYTASVMDLNNR